MKKLIFLLVLTVSLHNLNAQNSQDRSLVNVSGEGTVNVEPDRVVIKSRIEHEGKSAAAVKAENDGVVDAIISFLKKQGVKENDIQTEYVNLNKRHNYETKTDSYVANQSISITLRDIEDYEDIMKGLLENGLNRIDGIQFESSEMEKYEMEARKLAILDAKSKAEQLVEPLDQKIGKAFSISESSYNWVQPVYRMEMADMEVQSKSSQQTIAPGELEVKIKVNVSFNLD